MDEMDRMLSRLPEHRPPQGLDRRVLAGFHRRHRRRQVFQYSLSTALVLAGIILLGPWTLSQMAQIQLPQSGMPILASTFAAASNAGPVLSRTWDGMSWVQASLSQSTGLLEAAGLLLLAAGALIGIDPLLPRAHVEPRGQTLKTTR